MEATVVSFNKGTAKLNGEPFVSRTAINATGIYTLVVTANNTNTIHFSYIKYGDITGYGLVNSSDLTVLKQHLLKINILNNIFLQAGNLDYNSLITISDIIILKKKILGIT